VEYCELKYVELKYVELDCVELECVELVRCAESEYVEVKAEAIELGSTTDS